MSKMADEDIKKQEQRDQYTPKCLQDLGAHYSPLFHFDPEEHKYTFDGREMTGTTSALRGIKNPDALLGWAASSAVDHIQQALDKHQTDGAGALDLDITFEEARTAHLRIRNKRRDEGTDTHGSVEEWIKRDLTMPDKLIAKEGEFEDIMPFIDWANKEKICFLGSEVPVYSQQEWVGGIIDFLFEKDGKVYVGDLKTNKRPRYGSGIYYSYWLQLASYRNCIESLGGKVDGQCIVRMNGNDIEVAWRDKYETDRAAFLGALQIYRATREYEQV